MVAFDDGVQMSLNFLCIFFTAACDDIAKEMGMLVGIDVVKSYKYGFDVPIGGSLQVVKNNFGAIFPTVTDNDGLVMSFEDVDHVIFIMKIINAGWFPPTAGIVFR